MSITSRPFGVTPQGQQTTLFTMTNKKGASVSVLDFGAIVTSIIVPDKNGKMADVTLGFDTLESYMGDHAFMGDIVGRYGNRIAFRYRPNNRRIVYLGTTKPYRSRQVDLLTYGNLRRGTI